MNLALNEQWDESSVLMENTYIPELPDGSGMLAPLFVMVHCFSLSRDDMPNDVFNLAILNISSIFYTFATLIQ